MASPEVRGVFAIVIMLFAPKGLWGYLSERHGLVLFPIRRRLVANHAVANRAAALPERDAPGSPGGSAAQPPG